MNDFLKRIPIPTAGVALGLAALGILLEPTAPAVHTLCGLCSLALMLLLAARLACDPAGVRRDFDNPVLASVSATFPMAAMQLSPYLAPVAPAPAFGVWACAVAAHLALIAWFSVRHVRKFDLKKVYPTYFICYVGIVVASVTSPVYGMQNLGFALFVFGFATYIALLVAVTARYAKHPVEEGARPLFCIYTAPMSLSLAGYLATAHAPDAAFACVLAVCAQLLLVVVLARLPHFLRLRFYPSYAAMTFPFVITATALWRTLALLDGAGVAYPTALRMLAGAETALACAMVAYVFARYLMEFARIARETAAGRAAEGVVAD